MTEQQAKALAKHDRNYRAKKLRDGEWIVWSDQSDHRVEFDQRAVNDYVGDGLDQR